MLPDCLGTVEGWKEPDYQVGMWQVSAKEEGLIQTLHWNGTGLIQVMKQPWWDAVKFAAAMIVHAQAALVRDGWEPEFAKTTVLDGLGIEMAEMVKIIWEDYYRQKRAFEK